MRYQFVVTLRRDSDRKIDVISILLCFFSVVNFLLEQVRARQFKFLLSFFAALVLGGTLMNIFYHKKYRKGEVPLKPVRYKYWLLIAGLGWLAMPYLPWLSVFFFLLTFLEYQAKYPLEIGFADDRVVINTLFKRKYDWSAFHNIVLKDGLLTLDFRNNRLFQKEVMEDEDDDGDEDEFNDYCRGRIFMEKPHSGI